MGLSPLLADCAAAMLQMCPIVTVRVKRPYPPQTRQFLYLCLEVLQLSKFGTELLLTQDPGLLGT